MPITLLAKTNAYMELRDFITTTLTEIQAGVKAAITATGKSSTGGAINPCWTEEGETDSKLVEKVQFDIAVTVADKSATNAEGGIKVVGIKVGGDVKDTNEKSHVSRIQFSIPIVPPVTRVTPTPTKG